MKITSSLGRLKWLCSMKADKSIHDRSFRVALCLADRCNEKTGQCNPEEITIGKDTSMSTRSIERAVSDLKIGGYLEVFKTGKLNNYILLMPNMPNRGSEIDIHPTAVSLSPDSCVEDTRHSCRVEPSKEPSKEQCDDLEIAEMIFQGVRKLNPKHKKPEMKKWADDIRKMRKLDDRSPDQIRDVFKWANGDGFWQSNILSPAKLRKQFDQLLIKMNGSANSAGQEVRPPLGAFPE